MQAVCECSWGGEEVLAVCMLFPRPPWARPALPHVDVMQPSGGPLGTRISVLLFLSIFASPEPHCAYTPLLPSTLPASPVSLATVLRGHLKAALFLTCCHSTWLRKASPTLSVAIWLLIKRSHFITAWFQFWSLNLWTLFTFLFLSHTWLLDTRSLVDMAQGRYVFHLALLLFLNLLLPPSFCYHRHEVLSKHMWIA